MYKCIIVDDEKPARDEIEYFLKKEAFFSVVAIFDSSKVLLDHIDKYINEQIIFFLDIDMPIMNGISLSKKLKEMNPEYKIIFTTAYEEYALKAFDLDAFDYLLKPIENKRMDICLSRLKQSYGVSNKNLEQKLDYISIEREGKIYPIRNDEIYFVKALNRGIHLETTKGEFDLHINLSEMREKLNSKFFKCHRSYLININHIDSIEPWFNRTYQIKMKNSNEEIPVSRNYVCEFKRIMSIM